MNTKPYWKCCLLISSVIITFTVSADPIHDAAIDGDVDKVLQQLNEGVDVNAPDPGGTPLQYALFTNQTAVVRLLLERGANPNIKGATGTPLQAAALSGNPEVVKLLLDHDADPNMGADEKPLHWAMRNGSLEIVELLLAKGANPNSGTIDGITPLHEAAKRGELEIVKTLIGQGAEVNALTVLGMPPIHFAVRGKHAALAAYLEEQGATPGKIEPVTELLASSDAEQGKLLAEKECKNCHHLGKEGKNYVGPPLWDVVGRTKGEFPDFPYSPTFKTLDGTWTFEALNEYLARPTEIIPGTKMEYRGIADPQTRANVLAYLRSLSDNPVPFP